MSALVGGSRKTENADAGALGPYYQSLVKSVSLNSSLVFIVCTFPLVFACYPWFIVWLSRVLNNIIVPRFAF